MKSVEGLENHVVHLSRKLATSLLKVCPKTGPLYPELAQLPPYNLAFKPLSDPKRQKQVQELIGGKQPEPIKLQAQPKLLSGGDLLRSIRRDGWAA